MTAPPDTVAALRAEIAAARRAGAPDVLRHLTLQRLVDALDRVQAAWQRLDAVPAGPQDDPANAQWDAAGAELARALVACAPLLAPDLRARLAALAERFDDAVSARSRRHRSGQALSPAPQPASVPEAAAALPMPSAPPALFGAAAPSGAAPGSVFAVQFVAYPESASDEARALLSAADPGARAVMQVGGEPLALGTRVEVVLSGAHLTVEGQPRDVQRFVWRGRTTLLGFEVEVAADAESTVLRLDVSVDGIVLARIRLPLQVSARPTPVTNQSPPLRLARKAFASYSSKDRERVIDRVAAIRIAAGVEVFLDCHDLNPGQAWEPNLARAIDGCDTFLLFWSDAAACSPWVEWEWQRALGRPGLDAMQFHPLENGVKPPRDLAAIHLGDPYMDLRAAERVRRATAVAADAAKGIPVTAHFSGKLVSDKPVSEPPLAEKLVIHLDPDAVDTIPLGVMRGDLDGRLVYLNRAVQRLLGPDLGLGARLTDFEFAPESRGVVAANLERRFAAEEASDYPICIVHPDRTRVHAEISGVPEYDADGRVIGSVGFVTDRTMDRANLAIHSAISTAGDGPELLHALDAALRELLAFDTISVTLISEDRSALRVFYDQPHVASPITPAWRWWPMPAFVRADLDTILTTRPDSVQQLFSAPPYSLLKETDAATRAWLLLGYQHLLRKPVMRDGRLIALVTLFRKDDRPFIGAEVDRIEQLPISEAIHIALSLENRAELEFTLQLINRLGSVAESIAEVGRVVVDEVRLHFEWEHVSLFRVDHDNARISMVHQSASEASRLPEGYEQPVSVGLLGTVAQSAQPVRTGDAPHTPGYLAGIDATCSEMCLPIPGDRVRWILNVESPLGSAFAAEEQALVERLLGVAGLILDRTLAIEFNKTVLECSADGVLQTTTQGVIQYANPACADMLKRSAESLVGLHLSSLISADESDDDATPPGAGRITELIGRETLAATKLRFSVGAGETIPVLLSGNALPPQIGGRVYVASDLSYQVHVQRMDALQGVFHQVASESRVPLALSVSFLQELLDGSLDEKRTDLVKRAIAQLRRADLPLERLIRLASVPEGQELPLRPVALPAVARKVVDELPAAHARQVSLPAAGDAPHVLAALPELEFCTASVLAFLLRMKAQRDGIAMEVTHAGGHAHLEFKLVDLANKSPSATRLEPRSDQERDFALAQPVIRNLMERMRGSFELDQREGLRIRLGLAVADAP